MACPTHLIIAQGKKENLMKRLYKMVTQNKFLLQFCLSFLSINKILMGTNLYPIQNHISTLSNYNKVP